MNTAPKPAVYHDQPNDDRPGSPGVVAVTGQWTINQLQSLVVFFSISAAVLWQSCRLLTWRRTVRAEFFHQCHQVGTRALPFIMLTAFTQLVSEWCSSSHTAASLLRRWENWSGSIIVLRSTAQNGGYLTTLYSMQFLLPFTRFLRYNYIGGLKDE